MKPLLRTSAALALALVGLALTACTALPATSGATDSSATGTTASGTATGSAGPTGSITVFAAASMTNVLEDVAAAFTRATGTKVTLSFAASSALARQIEAGAQVDVFVSADEAWMDYLAARRLI